MKINAIQNNMSFKGTIILSANNNDSGLYKKVCLDTNDIKKIVAEKPGMSPHSAYIETRDYKQYFTGEAYSSLLRAYIAASQNDDIVIDMLGVE